jgi:4-alpha-glucanotransferase
VSVIDRRRAGILLHISSLPGPWGTGDLGSEAERFLRFLAAAGATLWQMLPVGPPGFADSPYQARSSFAGNPLFVPLELLAERGLLRREELPEPFADDGYADFPAAARARFVALRRAFERWQPDEGFAAFRAATARWLPEYALFAALHDAFGRPWWEWPLELVRREPAALADARRKFAAEIGFHEAVQWWFWQRWDYLRQAARRLGILLIGDVPFYPALDSADVWAHQELFCLDERGRPTEVAGVPPDAFSATGQRWGNPVYRWESHRSQGFGWWVERLAWSVRAFDAVRIDHFRGFAAAWHIPASAPTAIEGRWVPGPGLAFFDRVREALGGLPFILEDLGLITEDVHALRRATGCPGMAVLQFAFDGSAENPYLPHNLERNTVIYPGTHDNDTAVGWWAGLEVATRARVRRYLGCEVRDPAEALARLALSSVAGWALIPMQDVLRLGSDARMNTPARLEGNWRWRARREQMESGWEGWFRELAEPFGRVPEGRGAPG